VHPRLSFLVALAAASAAESPAVAGPLAAFLDGSVGLSAPHSDARYDEMFETGTQLGAHAGALLQIHPAGVESDPRIVLGLDLGADRTAMNLPSDADPTRVTRWRITAGPRLALQFPNVELFARAGLGVDRIHMDTSDVLEALCGDPTIQSAAFEGGVGVGVTTHHIIIGAQFGAGVSDHSDDRPVCNSVNGQAISIDVLDTRNVDLTAQLFVGMRL
jgi:hypothetical protein